MKVSVFGLGIIGSIWARHYDADALLAAAWNRSDRPVFPGWQPDAVTAARAGELLHLVVADPPAVGQVLDTIGSVLGPGKIVVQSSTIDPRSAAEFSARVTATGAAYVEAPFTGSKPGAEQRATTFYLGGEPSVLERIEPVLSRISSKRFRLGTPENAATIKLAMNIQVATVTEALVEGLAFTRLRGIADDVFFEVLSSHLACSGMVALKEPKLRQSEFSPQFSVKHLLKDLRLALGASAGAELPVTALLAGQLQRAVDAGWAEEDFSILIRLLRGQAG